MQTGSSLLFPPLTVTGTWKGTIKFNLQYLKFENQFFQNSTSDSDTHQ